MATSTDNRDKGSLRVHGCGAILYEMRSQCGPHGPSLASCLSRAKPCARFILEPGTNYPLEQESRTNIVSFRFDCRHLPERSCRNTIYLSPRTSAPDFCFTMSSKPRPIAFPRDLRSTPDEAEPSYSYEESLLGAAELDVEDEFHRRLAGHRQSSSHGSFWRSTSDASQANGPSFSSVHINAISGSAVTSSKRKSSGLLGAALQAETQVSTVSDDYPSAVRGTVYYNPCPFSTHTPLLAMGRFS